MNKKTILNNNPFETQSYKIFSSAQYFDDTFFETFKDL